MRLGWATATYDAEERTLRGDRRRLIVLPPRSRRRRSAKRPAGGADHIRRLVSRSCRRRSPPRRSAARRATCWRACRRRSALKPVDVTVKRSSSSPCTRASPTLRIVCSSGFYVRSLAHDLGQRLGCGAHLEALRRTRAGDFTAAEARRSTSSEQRARRRWPGWCRCRALLSKLPRVVVNRARRTSAPRTATRSASEDSPGSAAAALAATPPSGPMPRARRRRRACWRSANGAAGGVLQPVVVLV